MMSELDVGSLPVCGQDEKVKGMITDRDIVVKIIAANRDAADMRAGEITQGAVTIGADGDVQDAMRTMTARKVRRLPVLDGTSLVGMVTQADLARALRDPDIGQLVEALSTD